MTKETGRETRFGEKGKCLTRKRGFRVPWGTNGGYLLKLWENKGLGRGQGRSKK